MSISLFLSISLSLSHSLIHAPHRTHTLHTHRSTRQLLPIRLCILGPPAVGKSAVAKRLCEHYKLHHVHLKDVIDSAIQRVEQSANPPLEGERDSIAFGQCRFAILVGDLSQFRLILSVRWPFLICCLPFCHLGDFTSSPPCFQLKGSPPHLK